MEDDKNGAESKPLCLPRGPGPQGVPYAWLHKDVLWKIREGFDMTTYLDQALAVYLVHCELASDAQSPRYAATRRKIAERAGVSVRRVTDIHTRFQLLGLLKWEQQFIEGTKELGENIYTLMMSGTACTRSGTERKSENCTVNKQSSEKSTEYERDRESTGGASGKRLYGIPTTVEEVIAHGNSTKPRKGEATCRAFWSHYEGQAQTNKKGEIFWVTSGGAVVTNWRVKLATFGEKQNGA